MPGETVPVEAQTDRELLRDVMQRCAARLAESKQAPAYLRKQRVGEESVWQRYRLGVGYVGLRDELTDAQKEKLHALGLFSQGPNALSGSGVLIPTFVPPDMETPAGFVLQRPVQNKHRWTTEPKGIACPADLDGAERIVIADNPLLTLRMACVGVPGAVLAESPEVLPALAPYLKTKPVVLASCKQDGLAAMAKALDGAGVVVQSAVIVVADVLRSCAETLSALGLDTTGEAIEARLLADLVRYAQDRLAAGEGRELIDAAGLADPELVRVYQLGYLPADYGKALDGRARRFFKDSIKGHSLIVPASDETGAPVDLLVIRKGRKGIVASGFREPVQGLLAPRIATAFERIMVADTPKVLARLAGEGKREALFLRGVADAEANAERIYRSGVRTACLEVEADADGIAAALEKAGIAVEVPGAETEAAPEVVTEPVVVEPTQAASSSPAPEQDAAEAPGPEAMRLALDSYDAKAELARFSVGDATYLVEVAIDSTTRLQVRLERGGKVTLDRFDLASEQQRRRFAQSAALRTGVPFEDVSEHLLAILDGARKIQAERLMPGRPRKVAIEPTADEREEALEFLKAPDLLDRIKADLETLGWVGEQRNKGLLYLTATSRLLPRPNSAVMRAPAGSGKSTGVETVVQLVPPEDLIHCSRLTESSLYYADEDALAHKVLALDETDALGTDVLTHLRVLQTRGALSQTYTDRDPATGQVTTRFVEARGPVAVLMSTTGQLDDQNLTRCFDLDVDESEEQTAKILEAQRQQRRDPSFHGKDGVRDRIVRKHRNAQRLLARLPVLIPFADRIEFPAGSVRHRREQERFLNLVEASALLHQYRRLRHRNAAGETYIVADEADFRIAQALASKSVARASDELTANAREVLGMLAKQGMQRFSLNELRQHCTGWSRHRCYDALEELTRLEYLTSTRGRGKVRFYEPVNVAEAAPAGVIRLKEVVPVVREVDDNFTPSAATG